jgi:hypothetical protein
MLGCVQAFEVSCSEIGLFKPDSIPDRRVFVEPDSLDSLDSPPGGAGAQSVESVPPVEPGPSL